MIRLIPVSLRPKGRMRVNIGLGLLILLIFSQGVHAHPQIYQSETREDVAEFIDMLVNERGFEREWVVSTLAEARQRQDILDLIARPAERVLQWYDYRQIFLTEARTQAGREFMTRYADALQRAEQEYGVPAEMITAIIGVETFYGRNKGRHRVLDALATLTFDYPPRAPFFRGQLIEFLELTRRTGLNPSLPMGSYAGAMGYPQFIPTSYRDFAVDFDGDGFADIWTNPVDAIGSVGRYFEAHGWQRGAAVAHEFRLTGDESALPELRANRFNRQTWSEVRAAGVRVEANLESTERVIPMAFRTSDESSRYVLGLNNFYVITRYNHSRMYALAVYDLASALGMD